MSYPDTSASHKLLLDLLPLFKIPIHSLSFVTNLIVEYILQTYKDDKFTGEILLKSFLQSRNALTDDIKLESAHLVNPNCAYTSINLHNILKAQASEQYQQFIDMANIIDEDTNKAYLIEKFYEDFKDTLVFTEEQVWYKYENGLWTEQKDSKVSSLLHNYKMKLCNFLISFYSNQTSFHDNSLTQDYYDNKCMETRDIIDRLNIDVRDDLIISKFFDTTFIKNLNTNRQLLSFSKYVYNLKSHDYREATKEDYLSVSCNTLLNDTSTDLIINLLDVMIPNKTERNRFIQVLSDSLIRNNEQNFIEIVGNKENNKILVEILNTAFGNDYCPILNDNYLTEQYNSKSMDKYSICRYARVLLFNDINPDKKISLNLIKTIVVGDIWINRIVSDEVLVLYKQFPMLAIIFSNNTMNKSINQKAYVDAGLRRRQVQINLADFPIELSKEDINKMSSSMIKLILGVK